MIAPTANQKVCVSHCVDFHYVMYTIILYVLCICKTYQNQFQLYVHHEQNKLTYTHVHIHIIFLIKLFTYTLEISFLFLNTFMHKHSYFINKIVFFFISIINSKENFPQLGNPYLFNRDTFSKVIQKMSHLYCFYFF